MLSKLRSSFSRADKKQDYNLSSTPPDPERRPSALMPLGWYRRKSSGSVQTLSTHRPSNSSLAQQTSSTGFENDSLGLQVIHEPKAKPIADIIFVHGLGGHSQKTWSEDHNVNNFWPGLWLPKDPKIGRARLLTYGYDSPVIGPKSVSNIMDFARSLLFDMRHSRGDRGEHLEIGEAPIIFVAHSMGGLVVKKAYLLAQNDESCTKLTRAISGIIFLSTPHRGSDLAHTLDFLLKILLQSRKSYLKELAQNSPAIEDINEQFRHVAKKLAIISFYETHLTEVAKNLLPVMIVPKDSAIMGYEQEELRELAANHHTICKYKSDSDCNYTIVRDALKDLVEKFDKSLSRPHNETVSKVGEDVRKALALSRTPVEHFNTLRKRWVAGTCEWFLKTPAIISWMTDPITSSLVWYNAPPANGKSVLSSYVIGYLQSSGYDVQYHFFSFGDQSRRSISGLLRSLAYQISIVMPEYGAEILAFPSEDLHLDRSDYHLLWRKLFEDLFCNRKFKRPLFWVIDGLDESESSEKVIGLLGEALSKSKSSLKILLTGRWSQTSELLFMKLQRSLNVQAINGEGQSHNQQDIELLVDHEVEFLPGSTTFKAQLRQQILERAKANFLWVSLVLEDLQACHREGEIRAKLDQTPGDMTKMYQRMESLIIETATEGRLELAKTLFRWAVCVPRPLTVGELTQAIIGHYHDIFDLKKTIRDVCGQFLLIDSTDHVTTVHQTARDFLTKSSTSVIAIDRQTANGALLTETLTYLCGSTVREAALIFRGGTDVPKALESKHAFAVFAAKSWTFHLAHADPLSDPVLDSLESFFGGSSVLDWIWMLAVLKQVRVLVKAGKALLKFVVSNRKLNGSRNPMLHRLSTIDLLERWSVDLVRITAKFNKHLVAQPHAIYDIIPALCPPASILYQQFYRRTSSKVNLFGQNNVWSDVYARISLPQEEIALKIVSSGAYIAALAPGGTVYVWDSTDFGEICKLHHGQFVTNMCMNSKGDQLVTYGFESTKVWNIPAGTVHSQVSTPTKGRAMSMMFVRNGERVLAATDDRSVRLLNIKEGGSSGWEELSASLLDEKTQFDSGIINSPSFMAINPAGTQIGVCYRSFPLTIWDLDSAVVIGRCMRPASSLEKARPSSQTWFCVELFAWNAVTGHVVGWHKGRALFKWHPLTGEHHEVAASVDALVSSPNGKVFVTSDSNGNVRVWNFSFFTVIYQLSSGDLVSGLSFSPDSTRFYDIRGSTITAWEPNGLLRLTESGDETLSDGASEEQTSTVNSHLSEASASQYTAISVVSPSFDDSWYAFGNDDGEVYLVDMKTTAKMELTRFRNFWPTSQLVWSSTNGILVAVDLASDIHLIQIDGLDRDSVKAVTVKRLADPKLDLQGRAVHQVLLDLPSQQLLVISNDLAQSWDINESYIKASAFITLCNERHWLNHPTDEKLFVGVGVEDIQMYQWSNLEHNMGYKFNHDILPLMRQPTSNFSEASDDPQRQEISNLNRKPLRTIHKVLLGHDGKHLLVHVREHLAQSKVQKRLFIIDVNALANSANSPKQEWFDNPEPSDDVTWKVEAALGILPGEQLFFLDRDLWLCSINLTATSSETRLKRHYFVPRDWTNIEGLRQCTILRDGTLLCPQEGNVVIARSTLVGIGE